MSTRAIPSGLILVLLLPLWSGAGCAIRYGVVEVRSTPTGAEVYVEGVHKDTTPCQIPFEEEGEFSLTLQLDGHVSALKTVTVYEREDDSGNAYLEIVPAVMDVELRPLEVDFIEGGYTAPRTGDADLYE